MWVCSFLLENSRDLFFKFDPIYTLWIEGQILQKRWFYYDVIWTSFFRILLFLNGLSYWSQIGPKWKIFWCSLKRKREKEIFSKSYHARHKCYRFFRKILSQNWLSVHQMHSRPKISMSVDFFTKNYFKISVIWDQSGICSSNRLEMRANLRIKVMTLQKKICIFR